MKRISVKVVSDDKADNSSTSVTIERRQGTIWNRMDGRDIVTNKDTDLVDFNLRPGDRLVIEAYPTGAGDVVYDRDQSAAVRASAQSGPGADRPGTSQAERPTMTPTSSPAPLQNPTAARQPGADTTKPVGQATPRPTGPGPDRGPELTQDKK